MLNRDLQRFAANQNAGVVDHEIERAVSGFRSPEQIRDLLPVRHIDFSSFRADFRCNLRCLISMQICHDHMTSRGLQVARKCGP